MFDDPTIELIHAAPDLAGLTAEELPKTLTQAYAEIVAARMRVRELANDERGTSELLDGIEHQVTTLNRLAFTQEAIASLEPESRTRRAAAFVAGTAHYVALQAKRLRVEENGGDDPTLSFQGIGPEVSATLLFLAAGASADAAEMSKEIFIGEMTHPVDARLLLDIKRLATGRLHKMLTEGQLPPLQSMESAQHLADVGAQVLYFSLLKCVHCIAADMLRLEGYEPPLNAIDRVEALCSEVIGQFHDGRPIHSTYAGPRHLASLLRIVAHELPSDSLARLPVPPTLDEVVWMEGLAAIARSRPYLWANHRDAVNKGYLIPGVSSAISFPTGAGKSTLSELKIHSTLCQGKDVVFLAPTLALVDQTARGLRKTFPRARLSLERANDNLFEIGDETRLQPISVMTPERCLAMLAGAPELFREVGLVIFDECHLLHGGNGRRAVDAMLCILNLAKLTPSADFLLLSAMMSNSDEIASWLVDLTARPCLSLTMPWKPTRQVRGSVVYSNKEIVKLEGKIGVALSQRKTAGPPVSLQRELLARPLGLLALNFRWESSDRRDYALLPLSERQMPLAISPSTWGLTANANQVAAGLAALASSNRRTKTLIFVQTIVSAYSAQKQTGMLLGDDSPIALTDEEKRLYSLSLEEMGRPSALYVEVENGSVKLPSLCHHGLLLPSERALHESLFRRPDGVPVLVATSTLAQGMNLPSHVVIIAGDSKFDQATSKLAKMHAHDLLNAAGRAGRAGESAYGLVLVIPTRIITVDERSNEPSSNWKELQDIFSQSDQCLAIEDPFEEVLDKIQIFGFTSGGPAEYLLQRLPVSVDSHDIDAPAKELLRKSLSGYLARSRGKEERFESAIEAAMTARKGLLDLDFGADWADSKAATFGVPPSSLRSIRRRLEENPPAGRGVFDWFTWTAKWLLENPALLSELTRPDSLNEFMGPKFEKLIGHEARGAASVNVVLKTLHHWITGTTLWGMQHFQERHRVDLKQCEWSRKFALRLVPELAHIFSLPELVRRDLDLKPLASVQLERLGQCIRDGFDSVEKLAMSRIKAKEISRVGVHLRWDKVAFSLNDAPASETWPQLYARVEAGINRSEAI